MAQYKRVLIKLSGEALGDNGRLFDFDQIDRVAGNARRRRSRELNRAYLARTSGPRS